MQTIEWRDLAIAPDRQRQEFDLGKLEDLATSIDTNGLIHPPAVRYNPDTEHYVLIAGERRVRAMGILLNMGKPIRCGSHTAPFGKIPILDLGQLSDAQAFEAELAENIDRENLTWQERSRAEFRLHAFRTTQAETIGAPAPTLQATATEIMQRKDPEAVVALGSAITDVATRIQLAKFLDDPDVAAAKSQKEAVKVVRAKQQAQLNAVAAQAFDEGAARSVPHRILSGPMEVHMGDLAAESFDVLLTDPPYGIGAQDFGEQSGVPHTYDDSPEYFEKLIHVLAEESFRVCKAQAHAYVFCDPRRFDFIKLHFELSGWRVWETPLIWFKGNGMLPRPDHGPRRTYEAILFASKGDKPVKCVRYDVISIPAVRGLQHGAQKPVELYVDLLARSCAPGDTVLDAFAGSGTVFPAANRARVVATGIELDEAHVNLCKTRMTTTEEDDGLPQL
jgi:site-specific DNA-methyltransferase (adenine-specific)